jgi:hypothetical protein
VKFGSDISEENAASFVNVDVSQETSVHIHPTAQYHTLILPAQV